MQKQFAATLAKTSIPHKQIDCYGRQIVVTCWSEDAARKFGDVLSKFATVRGIVQSVDENETNANTSIKPSSHTVHRVFAAI